MPSWLAAIITIIIGVVFLDIVYPKHQEIKLA